jgi:hypothetical protein
MAAYGQQSNGLFQPFSLDSNQYLNIDCVTGCSGGGGSGGAVTAASGSYADGALVTLGTEADTVRH